MEAHGMLFHTRSCCAWNHSMGASGGCSEEMGGKFCKPILADVRQFSHVQARGEHELVEKHTSAGMSAMASCKNGCKCKECAAGYHMPQ